MSKLYIVSIRPTLEYASIVWDGCSAHDIDKLEKVQLSAARILTGLPIFASRESIYTETGWQTLQNRRYAAKMITMFKIYNGYAPPFLMISSQTNMEMYPVITHEIKQIFYT